ncbi:hypothetical protein [Gordonia sputi]
MLDWTVNLIRQPDQYAADTYTANGLIVHSYPADIDRDAFSNLFFAGCSGLLELAVTPAATEQDARCAELARMTEHGRPVAE